jgi:hypothetical protein
VSLELVAQLPGGDEDCIKQLVDLQVPCLGLMEDFHLFPLVQAQGAPDPLGPEGPLKSGTPRLFGHEGPKRPPGPHNCLVMKHLSSTNSP